VQHIILKFSTYFLFIFAFLVYYFSSKILKIKSEKKIVKEIESEKEKKEHEDILTVFEEKIKTQQSQILEIATKKKKFQEEEYIYLLEHDIFIKLSIWINAELSMKEENYFSEYFLFKFKLVDKCLKEEIRSKIFEIDTVVGLSNRYIEFHNNIYKEMQNHYANLQAKYEKNTHELQKIHEFDLQVEKFNFSFALDIIDDEHLDETSQKLDVIMRARLHSYETLLQEGEKVYLKGLKRYSKISESQKTYQSLESESQKTKDQL
jgi:hypothetical protein